MLFDLILPGEEKNPLSHPNDSSFDDNEHATNIRLQLPLLNTAVTQKAQSEMFYDKREMHRPFK